LAGVKGLFISFILVVTLKDPYQDLILRRIKGNTSKIDIYQVLGIHEGRYGTLVDWYRKFEQADWNSEQITLVLGRFIFVEDEETDFLSFDWLGKFNVL